MPTDLIIMGVSTLSGFFLKYLANQQENTYRLLSKRDDSSDRASSRGGVWIRRFIVVVMMSIFTFIIIAPAFIPELKTVIVDKGWLFTTTTEINGIMYDETTRQILVAIIGYYFGHSSASK